MVNVSKVPNSFYTCALPYEGRSMVEGTSVMQKLSQLRKWIIFYNQKKYHWRIRETFETKSGNIGYILCREITAKEAQEIKRGEIKIVNDFIVFVDHVVGSVHPKEKRC